MAVGDVIQKRRRYMIGFMNWHRQSWMDKREASCSTPHRDIAYASFSAIHRTQQRQWTLGSTQTHHKHTDTREFMLSFPVYLDNFVRSCLKHRMSFAKDVTYSSIWQKVSRFLVFLAYHIRYSWYLSLTQQTGLYIEKQESSGRVMTSNSFCCLFSVCVLTLFITI